MIGQQRRRTIMGRGARRQAAAACAAARAGRETESCAAVECLASELGARLRCSLLFWRLSERVERRAAPPPPPDRRLGICARVARVPKIDCAEPFSPRGQPLSSEHLPTHCY